MLVKDLIGDLASGMISGVGIFPRFVYCTSIINLR